MRGDPEPETEVLQDQRAIPGTGQPEREGEQK